MKLKISNYIIKKIAEWAGKRHSRICKLQAKYRELYWKSAGVSFGVNLKITGSVKIYDPVMVTFGDHCTINEGVIIVGRDEIEIGNRVRLSPGAMIISGMLDRHNKESSNLLHVAKKVVIEDGVWIASGSIILPGVTIGSGSVIAAGSVVTKDVTKNSVIGGIPGKAL